MVYPFAVGGIAFTAGTVAAGHGRAFASLWRSPEAYLRCGLMLVMQLSVLAATYLAGAVDASLLALIGDVVATPIVAAALFAGPRSALRRPWVIVGLCVSLAGGCLAILGGRRVAGVHGLAWLAVVAVPLAVAFYFLLAARASERAPMSAVVGQATLCAAVGAVILAPFVPGGWASLLRVGPTALMLLVANGVVSFFAAPALYFLAIRREGIVVPSMLMTAIPIFTLFLSVEVLGESVPWLGLAGIPVAVAGAVIALRAIAGRSRVADGWVRATG